VDSTLNETDEEWLQRLKDEKIERELNARIREVEQINRLEDRRIEKNQFRTEHDKLEQLSPKAADYFSQAREAKGKDKQKLMQKGIRELRISFKGMM